ncbi:Copper chaperone, partial [Dysosmobacter welbionis]
PRTTASGKVLLQNWQRPIWKDWARSCRLMKRIPRANQPRMPGAKDCCLCAVYGTQGGWKIWRADMRRKTARPCLPWLSVCCNFLM